MKFYLDPPSLKIPYKINHNDSILLLGSCFSDEMLIHFQKNGFNVKSSEFGTLFHPTAISNLILTALNEKKINNHYFERDSNFFSWLGSGKFFAKDEKAIKEKENQAINKLKENIINSTNIIFTFGTAWGYRLKENNQLVSNCHKAPIQLFNKELSEIDSMEQDWLLTLEVVKKINPKLNILFTVSPVRHIKDGLIENGQSKARLLELVHRLTKQKDVYYFPSYEIITDCLRDYRFYKSDLIHPSNEAILFVWNYFKENLLTKESIGIAEKVNRLHNEFAHKPLYLSNLEIDERNKSLNRKKEELLNEHSEVIWF